MSVVLAMTVFVVSHIVVARSRIRPWLIERIGTRGYIAAYSLMSIALLGWVAATLLQAPRIPLWPAFAWAYPFALVMTAVAFALIGIGVVVPNPLSVSFRKTGFDAARPGVLRWTRHPMLWGMTLWGVAHLPANGDWPSIALFGGAAAFGLAGIVVRERSARKWLGAEGLRRLRGTRGGFAEPAGSGVLFGLLLWLALLISHPFLFGFYPLAVVRGMAH